MDIIERAARAIAPMLEGGREFDQMPADRGMLKVWARQGMCDVNDASKDDAREAARAVLSALREPDEGMLEGPWTFNPAETSGMPPTQAMLKLICQAMIDEALREK